VDPYKDAEWYDWRFIVPFSKANCNPLGRRNITPTASSSQLKSWNKVYIRGEHAAQEWPIFKLHHSSIVIASLLEIAENIHLYEFLSRCTIFIGSTSAVRLMDVNG
jgi:hypothetical protein